MLSQMNMYKRAQTQINITEFPQPSYVCTILKFSKLISLYAILHRFCSGLSRDSQNSGESCEVPWWPAGSFIPCPLWPSLGSVRSSDSEARRQQFRVLFPCDNSQFTLWGQQMRASALRLPSFQAISGAHYR